MPPFLSCRRRWSIDQLSRADVLGLLEAAHALKRAETAGLAPTPLRGKNIALLSEGDGSAAATALRDAARSLGARVSLVLPSVSQLDGGADVAVTARMLGRLYDAVDCEGLAGDVVEEIAATAGVPVFDAAGAADRPMRLLAALMAAAETTSKPLDALSLAYVGDPAGLAARDWRRLAALTGIELRLVAGGAEVDAAGASDAAARVRRFPTRAAALDGADADCDAEAAAVFNHRYTLRALLAGAIG